jgi:hypothetical protein
LICCALPIILVTLGLGATVAALAKGMIYHIFAYRLPPALRRMEHHHIRAAGSRISVTGPLSGFWDQEKSI